MTARHTEVVNRIITVLKTLTIPGVSSSEIYRARFPFDRAPSRGIAVSHLTEREGTGLNDADDFSYPVQLTRIVHALHPTDGLDSRDDWRQLVFDTFNRKRIGVYQEISTNVTPGTIEIRKDWVNWNIDSSVLIVTVLVRRPRPA